MVKRYEVSEKYIGTGEYVGQMVACSDGDYVEFSDYDALAARLAECEAECLEQARLNGMGSEREARLLARLAEAERDKEHLQRAVNRACQVFREDVLAQDIDGTTTARVELFLETYGTADSADAAP